MKNKLISDIPDYPSIKKLASALHQLDASQHGAAIMIGAGFGRSAAHHVSGAKKMPLWDSLTKKLLTELNPKDTNFSFSDPLRVAEEYRAYFGQAALSDRIRSEIDNDAWGTGELYQFLLELPWSEIMTTNWDTLLERAAEGVHGPYYTPVTKPTDLTWASSPRIVKLHGTIGTSDTFIVAQEDYRTYPEKFAPFVNFVRQVFIENELCLLGFSGDDPNFLHWAGWVRDHLAGYARKIYLVGVLRLTAARRKHLESINIAPIDLWDLVEDIDDNDLRHRTATELFLQALLDEGKSKMVPYEWSPRHLYRSQDSETDLSRQFKDPVYAAQLLSEQLEILQNDRESYPGWLVCPPRLLSQIKYQLTNPWPSIKNIQALDLDGRSKLLYEIAWRYSVTFDYIPPWLVDQLFLVASSNDSLGITKRQQMEIALVLLKNSRWLAINNEDSKQVVQEHSDALVSLLENNVQYFPDCAAEIAYHQALVARDMLDYGGVEKLAKRISGEDPVWKLRQAALLMELGEFEEGRQKIMDAYRELQERYRYDQSSIRILSRLAWAHFLLKAATQYQTDKTIKALPPTVKEWQCDSWIWIENIQDMVAKQNEDYQKNQNSIEPLFGQGHYRDNSSQRTVSNETSAFLLLDGVTRDVGIPLHSGDGSIGVDLLASVAEKLTLAGGVGVELSDFTTVLRAASSENSASIKGVFTRIGLARVSQDIVDTTVGRVLLAIDFWQLKLNDGTRGQKKHSVSVLRVLIAVLSRLVVRLPSEKSKEVFRLAVRLGKMPSFQHVWLCEVLDSLLTNSIESVQKSEQGELLQDALTFPLPSEIAINDFTRWPNPIVDCIDSRSKYESLERRIDDLVLFATPNGTADCAAALLRLLPLSKKDGFLTSDERAKLAQVLWGKEPTYKELPNIPGIYPHAFLFLPAQDPTHVRELVRRSLYENAEVVLQNTQKKLRRFPSPEIRHALMVYGGISNAAANGEASLFPTSKQALKLFDHLVLWRPLKNDDDTFGFEDSERKRLLESIGNALSYSIAPALSIKVRNSDRFEKIKSFYQEIDGAVSSLPALACFVVVNKEIANFVEIVIRKSLQGRSSREVSYAAIALQKWMDFSEASYLPQFSRLISKLITVIESGRIVGLQHLLWVAGELFKNKRLTEEQIEVLIDIVPNVFRENGYEEINPIGQEAVSASSLREGCVKLANLLICHYPSATNLKEMLDEARGDALPEVRFALDPSVLSY